MNKRSNQSMNGQLKLNIASIGRYMSVTEGVIVTTNAHVSIEGTAFTCESHRPYLWA